jgi:NADPH:quinone reductase-like Zn-dependent oxidoreductase
MPIFATSSPHNQAQLISLGATQVFNYRSPGLVSSIKAASPEAAGVDMIIDCLAAGATQTDICDSLDPTGSKKYSSVTCGITVPVPEGVTKFEVDGMILLEIEGGERVIPALTDLIEGGRYQVPLPVSIVGNSLSEIADVMDDVKTVSGTKLVVKL